jgi:ADP-ribosylglycohydrolase
VIGAIAGDIIGSIYEHHPIKTKQFPLFGQGCRFTDDTVLTVAVAETLLNGGGYLTQFRNYFLRYPGAGYGGMFRHWAHSTNPMPYNSFGNGSAMRVSPVAFAFGNIEGVRAEARRSAEVTHNHPEGIKGAEATAVAVFLARRRESKNQIRSYIQSEFGYDLSKTPDEIRPNYVFDVTCQGTVPPALCCFLHSEDLEDAIRNAVSLGGDSDTLACIAGGVAGAYYGVPPHIKDEVEARLDKELKRVTTEFTNRFGHPRTAGGSLDAT